MKNNDLEIDYTETYETWSIESIYNFRFDFNDLSNEDDVNHICKTLDSIFNPVNIIVFIQAGNNFVEGFIEDIYKQHELDSIIDLFKKASRKIENNIVKVSITKKIGKLNLF